MTDLHSLIHRMADELDHYRQLLMDDRREVHALATEARAALAQPEPEPEEPTKAEIHAIADALLDGDSASRIDFARAVLARWGRPAPQPVPVSERPWEREGWCDAQGFCWLCNAYSMGRWNYEMPPDPEQNWGKLSTFTHSLPFDAIPRPQP
jgi:hypothetical protein